MRATDIVEVLNDHFALLTSGSHKVAHPNLRVQPFVLHEVLRDVACTNMVVQNYSKREEFSGLL